MTIVRPTLPRFLRDRLMSSFSASSSDTDTDCAGDPSPRQSEGATRFRQYRAPQHHAEAFIEPSLQDAAAVLSENRRLATCYHDPIARLRASARRQLIENARRYTGSYRDVDWLTHDEDCPIIMAGHQPALFHPGVWFKNFALSRIASDAGGLAINLVVDNDVATGSSIRVPGIDNTTDRVRPFSIAYDTGGGGVPYEQTTIRDRRCFDSFATRVRTTIAPFVAEPCVTQLWQHAVSAVERCGVAGCALAQSRHALEAELGLKTLEVPLGTLCRGTAFSEFLLSILTELPRFRACYNEAADLYRAEHGIRSTAHPVPNLAEQDGWFEAPLWIYADDAPVRRAAWVRLANDELVISDRGATGGASPRSLRIDIRYPKLAAEQLAAAASPQFKLRPRALLTTMYARLVLSDLFLHGIGGAKYDQLGDMIIESYFAIRPPRFMVISATVLLPGVSGLDRSQSITQLRRQIRDTRYQPERFADLAELDPQLVARKRSLLDQQPIGGSRKGWHDEITQANESLSRSLDDVRSQLQRQLAEAQRAEASAALLSSREHPFCLFPLEYLTSTFESLLSPR